MGCANDLPRFGCCDECDCGSILVTGKASIIRSFYQHAPTGSWSIDCATSDPWRIGFFQNVSRGNIPYDANGPKRYLKRELTLTSRLNAEHGGSTDANLHLIEQYDRCGNLRYKLQEVNDPINGVNVFSHTMAADGTVTEIGHEVVPISPIVDVDNACEAINFGGSGSCDVEISESRATVNCIFTYPPGHGTDSGFVTVSETLSIGFGVAEIIAEAQSLADLLDLNNLSRLYGIETFPDLTSPLKLEMHNRYNVSWKCGGPGTEEYRYPTVGVDPMKTLTVGAITLELQCVENFGPDDPITPILILQKCTRGLGDADGYWSKALVRGETGDPTGRGLNTCYWYYMQHPGHPRTVFPGESGDDSQASFFDTSITGCTRWFGREGPCSMIVTPDSVVLSPQGYAFLGRRCELLADCEFGFIHGGDEDPCCFSP